jgi:gamma-glutamyltranspeptidase
MTPAAAALPVPGRSVVASQHGVAASSQPLAAQAAVQVLQRGGNAVDAAVAANAVLGVTEPTSVAAPASPAHVEATRAIDQTLVT